jgi:two-component system sensor histidine kinase DegS
VWDLLPHALQERGVEEALRDEVRRFAAEGQAHTSFDVRGRSVPLGSDVEQALLRVCQESLTNVRRHAAATDVSVTLSYDTDCVRLQVLDNGIGIDLSAKNANGPGRGIAGMDERARLLRGRFLAEKVGSAGTRVSRDIPLVPAEAK